MFSLDDYIRAYKGFFKDPRVFITALAFGGAITYFGVREFPSLVNADVTALKSDVTTLKNKNSSLLAGNSALQAKLATANADVKNLRNALTASDKKANGGSANELKSKERALSQAQSQLSSLREENSRLSNSLSQAQSQLSTLREENAKLANSISASKQNDDANSKPNPEKPAEKAVVLSDDAKKVLSYFFGRSLGSDLDASRTLHMEFGRVVLAINQLTSNDFLNLVGGESGSGSAEADYSITPNGAAFAERNGISSR
jgi:hypothetical protein